MIMETDHRYDDLLDLPHPTSTRHPRMSMTDRAAQFSPFAALTGYGDAILETARRTDERRELDDQEKASLDEALGWLRSHLAERPPVRITYFRPDHRKAGGVYLQREGRVRNIDDGAATLVFEGGDSVPLLDIAALERIP